MSFDYDLKSNLVATISNHSQSQSKLQLDKQTGLLSPLVNQLDIDKNHKLSEWVQGWGGTFCPPPSPFPPQIG